MINSYFFIETLSDVVSEGEIIVTGVGTAYTGTHQSIRLKKGQRFITNIGCGGMGHGLPGAIGLAIASGKRVILIDGDGGFQMNLQEMATIVHHKLPIKMFILNNQGYQAILITQRTYFQRYGGIDAKTGVSFPEFRKIAKAYGVPYIKINQKSTTAAQIKKALNKKGPVIVEVFMPKEQELITFGKSLYKPKQSST